MKGGAKLAIKISELTNKRIVDKRIVQYDYPLIYSDNEGFEQTLYMNFKMVEDDVWRLFALFPPTQEKESQIYQFNYQMPKPNIDLSIVTATGLRLFQMVLQDEIQEKHLVEFQITNVIEDSL